MKKNLLIISSLTLVCLLIAFEACKKERLNFENLTTIEGSGEWSIPIVSSNTNITKILSQLDSSGYIAIQEDGSLRFAYSLSQPQLIKASDLMCFNDEIYETNFEIDNPYPYPLPVPITIDFPPLEQSFSLESDVLEARNAIIKSGNIHLEFSQNIGQIDRILITTDNIKDVNGDDLRIEMLDGMLSANLNVAGYRFVSNQENAISLSITITATIEGSTVPNYSVDSKIEVNNFCLKQAECLVTDYSIPFFQDTSFNLFNYNYAGDITIFEPKLFVNTNNHFDLEGSFFIDTAAFTGPDVVASLLLNGPTTISIPSGIFDQEVPEVKDIYFNTKYNAFKVLGEITLNPGGFSSGVVSIDEEDALDVNVSTEVPFDFMIGYAYYRDSFDFELDEIVKTDLLEEVSFQVRFTNDIPINLDMQIYSYNSLTNQITDSLFDSDQFFQGAFDGQPIVNDPVYSTFTYDDIQKLLDADKLILQIQLDTNDPSVQEYVSLTAEQFLALAISVRLKYDGVIITF